MAKSVDREGGADLGSNPAAVLVRRQRTLFENVAVLTIAAGLGLVIRLGAVAGTGFPLVDGGLFYAMATDIQAARFALPAYTSYNAGNIPFAYPPLGLYLAAGLHAVTGWRLMEVFHWLPLLLDLLTIPAFYALSRTVLRSKTSAAAAVIVFALLPEPSRWMIMGGGVTRSLGYLLAILALRYIYLMYTRARRSDVVLAAVFAAGTVLSHPQMAWFVAYSAVVLLVAFGRTRRGVIQSLLVGAGVLVLTSPWWVTVISRHGLAPFLSAGTHGWPIFGGLALLFLRGSTGEALVPVLGFATILGVIACLRKRNFWLPLWLLVTFAFDGWLPTITGGVPMALLAGVGVGEALWPLLSGIPGGEMERRKPAAPGHRRWPVALVSLVFLCAYATFASMFANVMTLSGLSTDEQAAMQWISRNTPSDSRFLVVTSERWPVDRSSEWFPVLAERQSVATVQGSEWIPGDEFARRVEGNTELRACPQEGNDCLERWMRDRGNVVTHVYIPKRRAAPYSATELLGSQQADDCCRLLRESLMADAGYIVAFDSPGATVFARANSSTETGQQ